jgi:prepilin-type N-terminal cleavage/methylation domain-containing protein
MLKLLLERLQRRRLRRRVQGGFTMLEVMMAMMVAMVGLMGTVAVQQTLLTATANAQDGAIALRLASQALEEFNSRVVQPGSPAVDRMAVVATGQWSAPVFLDATGRPAAAQGPLARWRRRTRVIDLGANQPYNISVEVQYALDTGNPKIIQLDLEKVK